MDFLPRQNVNDGELVHAIARNASKGTALHARWFFGNAITSPMFVVPASAAN
jgi:hypothetical protein